MKAHSLALSHSIASAQTRPPLLLAVMMFLASSTEVPAQTQPSATGPPANKNNPTAASSSGSAKKPSTTSHLWDFLARALGLDTSPFTASSMPRGSQGVSRQTPFQATPDTGALLVHYDLAARKESPLWNAPTQCFHSPIPLPEGRIAVLCHPGPNPPAGSPAAGVWVVDTKPDAKPVQLSSEPFRSLLGIARDGQSLLAWRVVGGPAPAGTAAASTDAAPSAPAASPDSTIRSVTGAGDELRLYRIPLAGGPTTPVVDNDLAKYGKITMDALNLPRQTQFLGAKMIATTDDGEIKMAEVVNGELAPGNPFGPNDPETASEASPAAVRLDPAWIGEQAIVYVVK